MKKQNIKVISITLIVILLFAGCSKDKKEERETKSSFDSLADSTDNNINLPEGVKVIDNPEEFKPVSLDQSYNLETDRNISLGLDVTTDGTDVYLTNWNNISVLDGETKIRQYICNKPQCSHNSDECSSYIHSQDIQYYEGFLYTVADEEVWEGDELTAYKEVLYRISTDGSSREKVCELATIYKKDIVSLNEGEGMSYTIYWMIHRGYIYYVYDIGTSGLPDDTYYNNMSNYISRMKIGENEKREYIVPLEKGSYTEMTNFYACGSYVYFTDVVKGVSGLLYRLNTESMEVEILPLKERIIGTYAIMEDCIWYTGEKGDTNLYQYSFNDNSIQKIGDFSEYEEGFGQTGGIYLFRDGQYVYATGAAGDSSDITRCIVLDYGRNYISGFNCCVEGNKPTAIICSINNQLMLTQTYNSDWYYFDKEELKTGEIQPVKVTDNTIKK